MNEIGATGLIMEINSVGCVNCRPVYRSDCETYFAEFLDELCPDCRRRYDTNPLRILDCKVPRCVEISKNAPVILDSLDQACADHFKQVQDLLNSLNVPFRIEPKMVRGLDYYTRTAFEIVHEELGRSKAGWRTGGRYDKLLMNSAARRIGHRVCDWRRAPCYGIARRRPSIRSKNRFLHRGFWAIRPPRSCEKIANTLRIAGYSVEMRHRASSLKSQMKTADKLGARKVIMSGTRNWRIEKSPCAT